MFFQAMAKTQDAGLVRHPCKLFKLRKLGVNGVSKKVSSMIGSDRVNYSWIKWVRKVVMKRNGGQPFLPYE